MRVGKTVRNDTLRRVMKYLEFLGLSVYGPNADVDTGKVYPANRDFTYEDIVKYAKLKKKGKLIESDYEGDEE